MPLKAFWCFSKNIDRLQAELDLRLLQVMGAATSSEAYGALQSRLEKQLGVIVKHSPDYIAAIAHEEELDRSGLAELKAMAKG